MIGQHIKGALMIIVVSILFFLLLMYREIYKSIGVEEGSFITQAVSDTVTVTRNRFSLPSLKAANLDDLYYAWGKTVSQDRMFQLRLFQIMLNGRYAELIDGDEIEVDAYVKKLNLPELADSLLVHLDSRTLHLVTRYCAGINSTVVEKKMNLSLPFIISQNETLDWSPADVLKLYAFLSVTGSINSKRDLFLSRAKATLPSKNFRILCRFFEIDHQKVIPLPAQADFKIPAKLTEIFSPSSLSSSFPFFSGEDYVIAAASSPVYPSFYYPLQLTIGEKEVTGAAVPGLPVIYQGFSQNGGLVVSFPENPPYALRSKKVRPGEVREETFSLKTKNHSESEFGRITLEEGFPLTDGGSTANKISYFSFAKKRFYRSFAEHFRINQVASDFSREDTISFPDLNYFHIANDTLISRVCSTEQERLARQKIFNDSLLNDPIYRKNTANEKIYRLKRGNFLLDYLRKLNLSFDTTLAAHINTTLLSWDRVSIKESEANYYFNSLVEHLIRNIFEDELAEQLPYLLANRELTLDLIEYLKQHKGGLFYAESKIREAEDFATILKKSLTEITGDFDKTKGMGVTLNFRHPLGKGQYKNILSIPAMTVNGGSFSWKQVKEDKIPALIFRIKSDDVAKVEFSFAGGISGNPLSSHYKNMLIYWQNDIYMDGGDNFQDNRDNELRLMPEK